MSETKKPYLSKNEPLGARKLFDKPCQYPECSNIYRGVGASKYCEEHQKQKYKKKLAQFKEIEAKKEYLENDKSNISIDHSFNKATETTRTCPCGKEYTITLFPNIYKYSKYCEEHRTLYRRKKLEGELNESK